MSSTAEQTRGGPVKYTIRVGTGRKRKRVRVRIVPRRRRGGQASAGTPRADTSGA